MKSLDSDTSRPTHAGGVQDLPDQSHTGSSVSSVLGLVRLVSTTKIPDVFPDPLSHVRNGGRNPKWTKSDVVKELGGLQQINVSILHPSGVRVFLPF